MSNILDYQGIGEAELKKRISTAKKKLGKKLVILGHHYQREEIIAASDFIGDSFGLSKKASETSAEFVVFCGVTFMAEAAKILSRPQQRVFHPNLEAGCPMADMAFIDEVFQAWENLNGKIEDGNIIPVVYMNSSAELKAFCGRLGGLVCTSSNAPKAFEWAFERGEKVFFFPDEHLGRNTARKMGIPKDELCIYKSATDMSKVRVLLWNGYCHVHIFFNVDHVKAARAKYPDCKIIVHPECKEEVVMASDESASTDGICKFVEASPTGSTIVIGTEINLVSRLAKENSSKNIVPLHRSLCPNMFKVSLGHLCHILESIINNEFVNEVFVDPVTSADARIALERMLSVA